MLTLKFKGGEVKVFVPPITPIMRRANGSREMLKPGAELRIHGTHAADGLISATGIIVTQRCHPSSWGCCFTSYKTKQA